jgi:hypothetical protein
MSREGSREDLQGKGLDIDFNQANGMDFAAQLSSSLQESHAGLASPSSRLEVSKPNRRPSKSISSARPTLNLNKRTKSYHNESPYASSAGAGPSSPSPNLQPLSITPGRNVMKRRTSTPSLAQQYLPEDDVLQLPPSVIEPISSPPASGKEKEKATESRARSTSTSFVYPPSSLLPSATVAVNTKRSTSPFRGKLEIPPPQWTGLQVTPASPEELEGSWRPEPIIPKPSFLTKAKELGETSLTRFTQWVKPSKRRRIERRRISEDDSEKGMSEDGGDPAESLESVGTTRASMDSFRAGRGKFWGFSDEDEDPGYFSLPPTPPEEKDSITLDLSSFAQGTSLPTPALSTRSLSRPRTGRRELHMRQENSSRGWLRHLMSYGSGTKTGQVIRELGWTVGLLAALFLFTGGAVLYLIKGMPM